VEKRGLAETIQKLVTVDLLVPESIGGPGRRGARLGVHGNNVARKARGLEAALVDKGVMTIRSLDQADRRTFDIAVAGPAALLVAKLHKISERITQGRSERKDSLDVLRLLRAIPTEPLARSIETLLQDSRSEPVTKAALHHLNDLFGRARGEGSQLAAAAAEPLEESATITRSCEVLASELLAALRR
jgi:hypothetical protein